MKFRLIPSAVLLLAALFTLAPYASAGQPQASSQPASQQTFDTAIYIPVEVVLKMRDPQWLATSWAQISSQVHVNKVYIETYRSRVLADGPLIESVKKFFLAHGVQVAGGICFSDSDNGQFVSFTYTKPADRAYVKHISEFTARHFDNVILDDFYFANTKAPSDIAAKGRQSWTAFRLHTMDEVSRDLVVGAAKAVNPNIKIVIKFPNWYEGFAANGYDLQQEPKIFSGIYAGTETRDPVVTDQNLQQYESYNIVRYFTNADPGHMGGGWADTYDIRYIDRYSEQLWLTVFAKAHEMTLFNYIDLLKPASPGDRPWSTDRPTQTGDVQWSSILSRSHGQPTFATIAGDALDQVKPFISQLGTPIGIAGYRPYHAVGEDYLHNFLGMIGIPINLSPTFPKDQDTVLLTEAAKADPNIVAEIKSQLTAGKNVVITSGLLHALSGKGIEDIVELRYDPLPVPVTSFIGAYGPGAGTAIGNAANPVLIPQIKFFTNDAWPLVRGIADDNAFPILLMDKYASGNLFVLTISDNYADLYELPSATLNTLRSYLMGDFPVRIDAPSKVSLFVYDNHSLIVESFRDQPAVVTILTGASYTHLKNLQTGETLNGTPHTAHHGANSIEAPSKKPLTSFQITLPPHSYMPFQEIH